MRLIDADARVMVQSFDIEHDEYNYTEMSVAEALDFATGEGCPPIIDAAPVVHGRWEYCGDDDIICNVCGARYLKERLLQSYYTGIGSDKMDGFWHCPHCGALLDGGGEA